MIDVNEFIQDRRGSVLAPVQRQAAPADERLHQRAIGIGRDPRPAAALVPIRGFKGRPTLRLRGGDLTWRVLRRHVVDSVAVRGRGLAPRLRRRAVTPSACALHSSQLVEVAQFLEDVHASLEVALIAG